MTVHLQSAMERLEDFLKSSGYFKRVDVGEPDNILSDRQAAIILGERTIPTVTLRTTMEVRTVILRIYVNTKLVNARETEFWLDEVQAELLTDICGDFDLGASVRAPRVTEITCRPGYQTVGTTFCRIVDMTLPLMVDDSATFTQ